MCQHNSCHVQHRQYHINIHVCLYIIGFNVKCKEILASEPTYVTKNIKYWRTEYYAPDLGFGEFEVNAFVFRMSAISSKHPAGCRSCFIASAEALRSIVKQIDVRRVGS